MSWKKKITWKNDDVVKYYRATAWAYEKLWGPDMHFGYWEPGIKSQKQAARRMNEKVVEKLGLTQSDYVLDAGCGVGGNAVWLAQTFGCRVTGITIVPDQVEKATARAKEAGVGHLCEFLLMDYMKLGFPDETFTAAMGLESICYAFPKSEFIKGIYRVLKQGGRFGMADGFACREEYTGKDARVMNRWMDGWKLNKLDTPGMWAKHAADAGFASSGYTDITKFAMPSSRRIFLGSLFTLPLHMLDKILSMDDYPCDAMWYQYWVFRNKLAEYGIFWAEK